MSSNEDPGQELEQVLQTYFDAEAERLKAPAGMWARVEAGIQAGTGRGAVPPVWQRLVQRGRWGLSPALAAVALLAIAVSIAWLAAAGSGRDGESVELALSPGGSSTAALPTPAPAARPNRFASAASATAAPAATSVPTSSPGSAGSAGAAGPAGPAGPPGSDGSAGAFNFLTGDDDNVATGWAFTRTGLPEILDDTFFIPLAPAQPPLPSAGAGSSGRLETVQRQVISQGSLSVEVEDVPSAAEKVRFIAEGVGGFVEQLSSQGVDELQRSTITIRIPQPEFFSVFGRIKALGKVLNENAGSEDVTERFIDLEARLKSSQREEQSLLALLERADRVSEILTIERELTRIRTGLEQVQGQLNFLERRVDLATIIVALFPPNFRDSEPASASLALVVPDVSRRVEETKALVLAAGGEIDQIFTTLRDGVERASLTVRVFAQDFDRVLSVIESQGEVKRKDVQQEITSADAETDIPGEPDSRITLEYSEVEEEESNSGVWIAIGSAASVVVLGFLFYVAYQFGQRRGEME